MLSIIYISFLAHRKTHFDLVHLKASREYPCEFQRRSMHDASLPCSPSGACGKLSCLIMEPAWWSAYSVCMSDYMVEMGQENGVRDGGDSFFETLWFDSARILYSVFVNRRFEIHPVLIHAALTSRIISVPDCKLQSGEYSHEIKYNNGISGLVHESGLPAYCVTRLRSLLIFHRAVHCVQHGFTERLKTALRTANMLIMTANPWWLWNSVRTAFKACFTVYIECSAVIMSILRVPVHREHIFG